MQKINKTICVYVRLSHEDSDIYGNKTESNSITTQRKLIYDFIEKDPELAAFKVIEKCDDGFSGTHFDGRPAFAEMIDLAKKGLIHCIIVKDFSRFGRGYVEIGNYLEQVFPFLGIRFISINDNYDSAKLSDGELGGLDVAFKNLVNDFYAREASKKLKLAWEQNAKKGQHRSGQMLLGYEKSKDEKGKLVIEPEGAKIVREIFDLKLSGLGCTEIARTLNEKGVPTPTEHLKKLGRVVTTSSERDLFWEPGRVKQILLNEKYTGTMVSLKTRLDRNTGRQIQLPESEWVRVEGTHEAIVSKEDFELVKASFHTKGKYNKAVNHIYYRCGVCGRRLITYSRDHIYCSSERANPKSNCGIGRWKKSELDSLVLGQLKLQLQLVMEQEELLLNNPVGNIDDEIRDTEKELKDAQDSKIKLIEKMVDRKIERQQFTEEKKTLDGRIAELDEKLSELKRTKELSKGEGKAEELKSFLEQEQMTDDIWNRFVADVKLYGDRRTEIEWKFDDVNGAIG